LVPINDDRAESHCKKQRTYEAGPVKKKTKNEFSAAETEEGKARLKVVTRKRTIDLEKKRGLLSKSRKYQDRVWGKTLKAITLSPVGGKGGPHTDGGSSVPGGTLEKGGEGGRGGRNSRKESLLVDSLRLKSRERRKKYGTLREISITLLAMRGSADA